MISREGTLNFAYYYSYNNLSCQRDNWQKMSMAYFYDCPFSCDEHAIANQEYRGGWQLGCNSITLKFYWWIQDGED